MRTIPASRCVVRNGGVFPVIIAQNVHFSYCFQGHFCKLPLLRVIFASSNTMVCRDTLGTHISQLERASF
eukprot:COSAG06_NODE_10583_length_1654_cov_1.370418_1_plen_69_part_10